MKKWFRLCAILLAFCFLIPHTQAQPEQKYIALTFDDGPAGKITEKLLDGLSQRNIPATFFLCCYRVTQYPDLVQRMVQDGHEIGVHGCSHEYFTQLSKEKLTDEILCTKSAVKDLTGVSPVILRPPGGLYNEKVRKTAEEHGFSMVLWSLDPEDWDPAQRKYTVRRVTDKAEHGDVVLLHDLSRENVAATLDIIDRLQKKGFSFCTVSQLAAMSDTTLVPGKIYTAFP